MVASMGEPGYLSFLQAWAVCTYEAYFTPLIVSRLFIWKDYRTVNSSVAALCSFVIIFRYPPYGDNSTMTEQKLLVYVLNSQCNSVNGTPLLMWLAGTGSTNCYPSLHFYLVLKHVNGRSAWTVPGELVTPPELSANWEDCCWPYHCMQFKNEVTQQYVCTLWCFL